MPPHIQQSIEKAAASGSLTVGPIVVSAQAILQGLNIMAAIMAIVVSSLAAWWWALRIRNQRRINREAMEGRDD